MKLRLRLRPEHGALQRVLVHTGRRGFDPVSLTARTEGDAMSVELEVRGTRDVSLLARTLERLYEVTSVEVVDDQGLRACCDGGSR